MSHLYTVNEQRKWQERLPKKNVSAHVFVRYQQKVLMVKPLYKNHFVFPGGVVDEGESPQQAAARELSEEVGVVVPEHELLFAGVSYVPPQNGFPEKMFFSFLYDCKEIPSLTLQEDEIGQAEWVSISDILDRSGKKRALYVNIQEKLSTNNLPFYSDLDIII